MSKEGSTETPIRHPIDFNNPDFLDPKKIDDEIRRVFDNIKAICEEADSKLDEIVKLNVSLKDLSIFSLVNEIMQEYFEEPYPARAALQVAKLPLDALIEVEAIIVK